MRNSDLVALGVLSESGRGLAIAAIQELHKEGKGKSEIRDAIQSVVDSPKAYLEDAIFGALAREIDTVLFQFRKQPAPYEQWGKGLEPDCVKQMENACQLPVATAGALMPDAHLGYGLPIGGVLATENAIIPYAVGVDIACWDWRASWGKSEAVLGCLRNRIVAARVPGATFDEAL